MIERIEEGIEKKNLEVEIVGKRGKGRGRQRLTSLDLMMKKLEVTNGKQLGEIVRDGRKWRGECTNMIHLRHSMKMNDKDKEE